MTLLSALALAANLCLVSVIFARRRWDMWYALVWVLFSLAILPRMLWLDKHESVAVYNEWWFWKEHAFTVCALVTVTMLLLYHSERLVGCVPLTLTVLYFIAKMEEYWNWVASDHFTSGTRFMLIRQCLWVADAVALTFLAAYSKRSPTGAEEEQ